MDSSRKEKDRVTFKNSDYHEIKITKMRSGSLALDHDGLKELLFRPEIGNRPIALISIAGCLRTGKSFLLNFLLRYLRNYGWENPEWMGTPQTSLDDGINWRGGQEPNTTGIVVWNEVFTLKRRNGQEIVVLLMDTQGLFDNNTTKENNVRLLMTSAIASSVQILNIKNLIQERDLENLLTCVQFAMAAAGTNAAHFQLQTLAFLIRDWDNIEENEWGAEGGKEYLDSVLRSRDGGKELNEVREHLRETFASLECFLMPEPGKNVRRSGKKLLFNKQIDEEFLQFVGIFADMLLHPDNIVVKQTQGKPMNARELVNLMATTDTVFGSGTIVVEDLLTSTTKAHYSTAYEESIALYMEEMEKTIGEKIVETDRELGIIHEAAKKKALDNFAGTQSMGGEEMRKKYQEHLIEECNRNFKLTKQSNETKKDVRRNKENEATDEAFKQYKTRMEEAEVSFAVGEDKLVQRHQDVQATLVEQYKKKANKENLLAKMKAYKQKKVKENQDKRETEKQAKNEREAKINTAKQVALLKFRNEIGQKTNQLQRKSDLKSFYNEKLRAAEAEFKTQFSKYESFDPYLKKLQKEMNDAYEEKDQENDENWTKSKKSIEDRMKVIAQEYRKEYEKTMSGAYIEPAKIEEEHRLCKEALEDEFERKFSNCPPLLKGDAIAKGKKYIDSEFKEIKEKNEKNKETRCTETSKPSTSSGKKGSWCSIL